MNLPCSQEMAQQSQFSPSTVGDEETLIYVLLDPDHWKEGRLTNAAFSKTKLLEKRLSVARREHTDASGLTQNVISPQISKNPNRRLVGVLKSSCKTVRKIDMGDPLRRAICVIDDGSPENPAHAHLGFSDLQPDSWDKNSQQAARASLIEAFNRGKPLTLDAVFPQEHQKRSL